VVTSVGNGRLDAVANAIQSATGMDFHLESYSEHSLDEGSTSRAASYVGLAWGDGSMTPPLPLWLLIRMTSAS